MVEDVVDQVPIMVDEQRNSRPNDTMTQQSPSPVPSQGSDPSATLSACPHLRQQRLLKHSRPWRSSS